MEKYHCRKILTNRTQTNLTHTTINNKNTSALEPYLSRYQPLLVLVAASIAGQSIRLREMPTLHHLTYMQNMS